MLLPYIPPHKLEKMTEYSAADIKSEAIQAMGENLGSIYAELWQKVAWLHDKWSEYVVLFARKNLV